MFSDVLCVESDKSIMKKIQEFEKGSLVLFFLMMSANVCNYLFQIIVGNMMTVEDYGIVNTVLGIVGILTIPTTIIAMICARYIALYAATENEKGIASVLYLLLRFVVLVGILLLLIGFLTIKSITNLFGLNSICYVAGALFITIINLFFAITSGTLQGLKKFFPYGIQTILMAGGKLVFSIALLLIGWRVYGVIIAIFCGILLAIGYGVSYMGNHVKSAFQYRGNSVVDAQEFTKYAIGAIVAQGCVIALTNGDILLVKAFFTDKVAGIYSSAMIIGKIAMYVSTAVVAALFPMVVEQNQKGEPTILLLTKAIIYGGGMAFACAVGMVTLGRYIIGILFGERYRAAIEYLPFVCLYVVPLTFISILMNYLLAIGQTKVFGISICIGLVVIIGISSIIHDTIPHIMVICGTVLIMVFLCNLVHLWYLHQVDKETNNLFGGEK